MPIKVMPVSQLRKAKVVTKPAIKSIRKVVKKMISKEQEKKYYIFGLTGDVTTSMSIVDLTSLLVHGTGFINREGEKCHLNTISLMYRAIAGDAYNHVRAVIVSTTENIAAPTLLTDVFEVSNSGTDSVYFNSHINKRKFRVHYDNRMFLNTREEGAVPDRESIVRKTISIKRKLSYNDTTGSADKYRLYWIIFSDSAASSHPRIDGQIKLSFTDLI